MMVEPIVMYTDYKHILIFDITEIYSVKLLNNIYYYNKKEGFLSNWGESEIPQIGYSQLNITLKQHINDKYHICYIEDSKLKHFLDKIDSVLDLSLLNDKYELG